LGAGSEGVELQILYLPQIVYFWKDKVKRKKYKRKIKRILYFCPPSYKNIIFYFILFIPKVTKVTKVTGVTRWLQGYKGYRDFLFRFSRDKGFFLYCVTL